MKKFAAFSLALLVFLLSLAACAAPEDSSQTAASAGAAPDSASEPVVLNVSLDQRVFASAPVYDLLSGAFSDGGVTLLTESIPLENPDREITLTRVRTEIMAGKGPDLFLCGYSDYFYDGEAALFPFPRQAMENRVFLPLDGYIANARHMEWDKLLPQVMEAGRNEEGQQLLPLSYEMYMTLVEKDQYTPTFDETATWENLAASDDPVARRLATATSLNYLIGEPADYDKDALAFSEEELLELVQTHFDIFDEMGGMPPEGFTFVYPVEGLLQYTTEGGAQPVPFDDGAPEYLFFPDISYKGETVAFVDAFAAINRNTPHPDECFQALDWLLAKQNQAHSPVYRSLDLPVHTELYSQDSPLWGHSMSQWNFQQFSQLRERISVVKFHTPLEREIMDAFVRADSPEELKAIVHRQYMTMSMMLAES